MKNFYKIQEIARLFQLHPDTLRYYEEKNLLHPIRSEKGYRLYSIQDICTLNVIRSLRELDLSAEEIRSFLEHRSIQETMDFLDHEEELLVAKMAVLKAARAEAATRRKRLKQYQNVAVGEITLTTEGARPYVFLQEDVILEKEVDFLLKKLEQRHQDSVKVIGSQTMGAVFDEQSLEKGIYNHFSSVFFLTRPNQPWDLLLPPGTYASLYYRGGYDRVREHLCTLYAGIRARGLTPAAAPLELYHIDIHDTRLEEEYVTQLQVLVQDS